MADADTLVTDADAAEAEVEVEAQAPPVVAVLVTHDAGPWLEDSLASIADQDYPNLSVLVIDTGTADDTVARVAAVLPSAYVRRIDGNPGFGAACNEVLAVVEGASFFAFCHDDVRLDPAAVRSLVEEAFRSNAGVTGPKYVRWDDPAHLLEVGAAVDKAGVRSALVERGELDQEQHDAVRDVFLLPGGCTLVRADLFAELGGFDPGITFLGEDLDLCWRAQIAGARVVVVPGARVEHRESMAERLDEDERRRLGHRHRLRTVLTCYSRFHLLRVLPQILVLAIGELAHAVVSRHGDRARSYIAAWRWNIERRREIAERRAHVREIRELPDSEVRRLQVGGSARMRAYVRGELHMDERLAEISHELSDTFTAGPRRVAVGAWVAIALVLLVGSRDLLLQRLSGVAGLVPLDESPGELLRTFLSSWREAGVGAEAPIPTGVGLLGVGGALLLGATGLLQQLLVLGALPAGLVGVWRVSRPLASWRARAAAVVVYAVVPLPYDALARGSWGGLLVYAAAPWLFGWLVAVTDDPFWSRSEPDRGPDRDQKWRRIAQLGLLTAALAAFVPLAALLVPFMALALWVGGVLTRSGRTVWPALPLAAAALAAAAVLNLPWTFDFVLPDSDWWAMGGVSPLVTDAIGVGSLLRFETGDVAVSYLGWCIPLAATLPLVVGREWRLRWAVRCWTLALASWALAWAAGHDLLGVDLLPAEILLVPAAVALSLSAALGVVAFERDLRGYRFGWRQLASTVAAGAVILAAVPVLVTAIDGRWQVPDADHRTSLSVIRTALADDGETFRVLWVGHPEVLPAAGSRLTDDLAFALVDGEPGVVDRWAAPAYGATSLVGRALREAGDGRTDRLGRLLAPFGVRFVILAERAAPARERTARRPLPAGLAETASRQVDLRRVDVEPALAVFENVAWAPVRTVLDADKLSALGVGDPLRAAGRLDLSGNPAVLPDRSGPARFRGETPEGRVYVATGASDGWSLKVGGEKAERDRAGWANVFTVDDAGAGSLTYRVDPLRWLAVAVQAAAWAAVIAYLVRTRRRRERT